MEKYLSFDEDHQIWTIRGEFWAMYPRLDPFYRDVMFHSKEDALFVNVPSHHLTTFDSTFTKLTIKVVSVNGILLVAKRIVSNIGLKFRERLVEREVIDAANCDKNEACHSIFSNHSLKDGSGSPTFSGMH